MRVLAFVHMGVPQHNAGAEAMLHAIMAYLVTRGHDARVIATRGSGMWTQQGVHYSGPSTALEDAFKDAALIITHLDETRRAVQMAAVAGKPIVHICHNHRQLRANRVRVRDTALVVFNSRWLQRACPWEGPSVVCAPPVFAKDYRTKPGDAITLINLSEAKGAPTFFELATRMPERRFLGVLGAYGAQEVPRELPTNVELWENRADARSIYRQTRVLLMPSSYESWGRVALEAASSGIPTIACPTPGLVESLGPAGIFVNHGDLDEWEAQIRCLEAPQAWQEASERVLERSRALDPLADLAPLEAALEVAASSGIVAGSRRVTR